MVAVVDPDPETETVAWTVLVVDHGGDLGHVIGNEAGALGRGNGVGGRALGPVRARKNGRRGHDRRTVREARDPGQGHEIGPRGRTGQADVTEETTGMASKMSPTRKVVSTATTG